MDINEINLLPIKDQDQIAMLVEAGDDAAAELIQELLDLFTLPALSAQVRISEIVASNDLGLTDYQGDRPDWLELYNDGPGDVDLGSKYLTDDPFTLTKWSFPAPTVLRSGRFLVVFASDKNLSIVGQELHTNFKLSPSGEYLALVDADGVSILDEYQPSYPQQVSDVSYGLSFSPGVNGDTGYFMAPTPGLTNGIAGPAILAVNNLPVAPDDLDDIAVEATVAAPSGQAISSVNLHYLVQFGGELTVAMADDGSGQDRFAGDGIWTGTVPDTSSSAGQMVRWRVTANATGGGGQARLPLYLSPTDSDQYFGVMIRAPGVASALPILNWFVQSPSAATTVQGTRCSLWFNDEFYDNVFVRRRGNSSSGWPKKNYKFDFNKGNHFRFDPAEGRVEEMNVNSTWSDKAFMRRILSWETYEDAGMQGSKGIPWRLQQNASFYSVATFVEQPDEEYLERNGLDPDGALYKMFNQFTSAFSGVEKKTRRFEGNGDLNTHVQAIGSSGVPLETYLFDNTDVPAVVSYLAATVLIHDNDHVAKNYYVYRDTEGDGEWQFLPWDKDLTFGRNYNFSGGVLNDLMWADTALQSHPQFGDQGHQKIDNLWNRWIDACYRNSRMRDMTMRRLRTLMDDLLQAPGTAPGLLRFEQRIDQLVALMSPDVALDQGAWGVPSWGSSFYTFANAVPQLKNDYLAPRRVYLYNTHGPGGSGLIPAPQGAPMLSFGIVEHTPGSGNQLEEFIEVMNPTGLNVDMSGWVIDGEISFTFPPGTVVSPASNVYVSPSLPSFRARGLSPKGGERRLVVGVYSGDLTPGGSLRLLDDTGRVVDEIQGLLCGDCNSDMMVNVLDALVGAQHAAGLIALIDPEFARCNVSGTPGGAMVPGAGVDILDAFEIARFSAGLLVSLSCSL